MASPDFPHDDLAASYQRRSQDLYETRAALGDAVSTLRLELEERREECRELHQQLSAVREDNHALRLEVERFAAEARKQNEQSLRYEADLADAHDRLQAARDQLQAARDQLQAAREEVRRLRKLKAVRGTLLIRRLLGRARPGQ